MHQRIIDAIDDWNPNGDDQSWPDARFETLAADLFARQYHRVSEYRNLCDRRDVNPDDDPESSEIPAVPTDAFKHVRLFCDDAEATRTFRTSGTTGDNRGAHHFATLDVYRASLHPAFRHFCNPDGDPMRILVLAPPPTDLPDSSLSFMLGELVDAHGDDHSRFFVTADTDGTWNLDANALAQAFEHTCDDGAAALVFGTAFGFAEFFDRLDRSWSLPPGSRLVETGGFKGRFNELSRSALYDAFTQRLGIGRNRCLSEYSMTELSSQTYTDHLVAGGQTTGRLYGPPWLDISIVDPVTLTPVDTPGQPGLIRFFDLANVDSISAIQTSDRGILHPDGGLELLGRAPDAQLRGCSLVIEEIVNKR